VHLSQQRQHLLDTLDTNAAAEGGVAMYLVASGLFAALVAFVQYDGV
jgi:hypothetical protein